MHTGNKNGCETTRGVRVGLEQTARAHRDKKGCETTRGVGVELKETARAHRE